MSHSTSQYYIQMEYILPVLCKLDQLILMYLSWPCGYANMQKLECVICKNITAKILCTYCTVKVSCCENFHIYGSQYLHEVPNYTVHPM